MADLYELVLHNRSPQPDLAFIAYAVPTMTTGVLQATHPKGAYPIAWQVQGVNQGTTIRFSWTASYALMCANQPCQTGEVWKPRSPQTVSRPGTAYLLDYLNDDYHFSATTASGDLPPTDIDLYTSSNIPAHGNQGPSIGLAISTTTRQPTMLPVIATDSGPNLIHRIHLPPTYHIWAGQDEIGAMLQLDTVRAHQDAQLTRTSLSDPWHAEWTLDATNHWNKGKPT